jgi:hypothetical protein
MSSARNLIFVAVVSAVLASACTSAASTPAPAPTPTPTPSPVPTPVPPAISGTLTSTSTSSLVADRHIVLCRRNDSTDLTCNVTPLTTTSDSAGHFEFATVPVGNYLVFYDSGWDDFTAGLAKWTGKDIHVGDVQWLVANYYDSVNGQVSMMIPGGTKLDAKLILYRFFGQSPFFWAHTCAGGSCGTTAAVLPVEYDVTQGSSEDATFTAYFHSQS